MAGAGFFPSPGPCGFQILQQVVGVIYCVYDVPENRVIADSSIGPYHFAADDRQTDPEQEHRMKHGVRYP